MRYWFILFIFIGITIIQAGESDLGIFLKHQDIGNVKIPGSAVFKTDSQEYILSGSGKNMWFDNDEFHYLYTQIKGDFILRCRIKFVGEGVDPHRKVGWIIRNSLTPESVHVNATVHGDGLTSLQFRSAEKDQTQEVKLELSSPDIIQLERKGDTFIFSAAVFGEPFTSNKIIHPGVNKNPFAGLYICSHNPDVSERAIFSNVRIIKPVDSSFTPYQDYIGSNLEILNIETGSRKIIYQDSGSVQAPNWNKDGLSLIYNKNGLLYNFNLKTRSPRLMNTGFATNNNNDHVLSFDGKHLGISHHSENHQGNSIIYTLPVEGGVPSLVTSEGPSYLHGWSPDGKNLVYTAGRNQQYDIYKINIEEKREIQLTNTKDLDDGSEYSPDGNYIYFNSNRTGTMQIWRMKPDGKNPEQLTFDEFNDWFPHVSPDGKWIAFLSYGPEIASGDHPFYKQVYLRIMPTTTGDPRIIAYLFGGQGTINVPSWSPDSKFIAFVSNSKCINNIE